MKYLSQQARVCETASRMREERVREGGREKEWERVRESGSERNFSGAEDRYPLRCDPM